MLHNFGIHFFSWQSTRTGGQHLRAQQTVLEAMRCRFDSSAVRYQIDLAAFATVACEMHQVSLENANRPMLALYAVKSAFQQCSFDTPKVHFASIAAVAGQL